MGIKKHEKVNIKGHHIFTKRDAITGKVISVNGYDNIVCNVLKNVQATYLASYLTYCAVGTGSGSLVVTNTTLWTEEDRVQITSSTASANIVSIIGYFGPTDGNGVLTEMAYFGGTASATPDSGTMGNHAEISETKVATETLTIQSSFTIG